MQAERNGRSHEIVVEPPRRETSESMSEWTGPCGRLGDKLTVVSTQDSFKKDVPIQKIANQVIERIPAKLYTGFDGIFHLGHKSIPISAFFSKGE